MLAHFARFGENVLNVSNGESFERFHCAHALDFGCKLQHGSKQIFSLVNGFDSSVTMKEQEIGNYRVFKRNSCF